MAGGGNTIKAIDKAAVHRICSGQVVLDLATAVKELVENSLDASARNIDIRLKEYGSELIEVADNGCGVAPKNHEALTLKYHTSKISTFSDLSSLGTFGFRGEALSSLCALADVIITTRTAAEPVATELTLDRSGKLARARKVARAVGTTVAVAKLFSPLPVRYREFTRNVKREYGKLLTLLQAYALISTDVRLICTNQSGSSGRSTVIQTQGGRSLRDNIVTVFGTKFAASLEPIEVAASEMHKVIGFVSKAGAGCGRASGDRQFFYVNGRPVEMPKVGKLLNETYRAFNSLQYPMAVLNFVLPPDSYDVNVTPDKRKVFLHAENDLLAALRTSLEQLYAPDKYVYRVQESQALNGEKRTAFNAEKKQGKGKKRTLSVDLSDEEGTEDESEGNTESEGEVKRGSKRLKKVDDERGEKGAPDLRDREESGESEDESEEKAADSQLASSENDAEDIIAPQKPVRSSARTPPSLDAFRNLPQKEKDQGSVKDVPTDSTELAPGRKPRQASLSGFLVRGKPSRGPSDVRKEPVCPELRESGDSEGSEDLEANEALRERETLRGQGYWERAVDGCRDGMSNKPSVHKAGYSDLENAGKEDTSTVKSSGEGGRSSRNGLEQAGLSKETQRVVDIRTSSLLVQEERPDSSTPHRKAQAKSTRFDFDEAMQSSEAKAPHLETRSPSAGVRIPVSSAETPSEEARVDTPGAEPNDDMQASFELERLKSRWAAWRAQREQLGGEKRTSKRQRQFAAASLGREEGADLEAAANELERVFSKRDFSRMSVCGQFNLGFIIARLDNDLFIVDQHASDEKFNFERLSRTTVLNKQPLLKPLGLDLTAGEEVTCQEHRETFRKNGFDFTEAHDAPVGRRLKLAAVPFSKGTTFGPADVHELVSLLADAPVESAGVSPVRSFARPSRVRNMLASRACRSSIMIGDPLNKQQMNRILKHLEGLDAPWNCPHGRPTMRHLIDLSTFKQ